MGKPGIAQAEIYNRFSRSTLQPLYKKLYGGPHIHWVSKRLLRIFSRRGVTLASLPPRIASDVRGDIDFMVYADASFKDTSETGGFGAVVIDRLKFASIATRADTISESIATYSIIDRSRRSSIVCGLGLTAVCRTVFPTWGRLRCKNP